MVLDDPPFSLLGLRARRWSGGGGLAWLKRPRGGCLKGLGLLRPHLQKAKSAAWGEVGWFFFLMCFLAVATAAAVSPVTATAAAAVVAAAVVVVSVVAIVVVVVVAAAAVVVVVAAVVPVLQIPPRSPAGVILSDRVHLLAFCGFSLAFTRLFFPISRGNSQNARNSREKTSPRQGDNVREFFAHVGRDVPLGRETAGDLQNDLVVWFRGWMVCASNSTWKMNWCRSTRLKSTSLITRAFICLESQKKKTKLTFWKASCRHCPGLVEYDPAERPLRLVGADDGLDHPPGVLEAGLCAVQGHVRVAAARGHGLW